jgi:hypothetical protein
MESCVGNCGHSVIPWDGWIVTTPAGDEMYFCSLTCMDSWLSEARTYSD